jgi:hypothetical protein
VKNVRIGSRMTIDREEYTAGASGWESTGVANQAMIQRGAEEGNLSS